MKLLNCTNYCTKLYQFASNCINFYHIVSNYTYMGWYYKRGMATIRYKMGWYYKRGMAKIWYKMNTEEHLSQPLPYPEEPMDELVYVPHSHQNARAVSI
jgi:hypothetical protein